GVYRGGTTEIMNAVSDAIVIFQRIATRVDTLLASFQGERGENFNTTMSNLERASGEMARVLEANREGITQSVAGLNQAMADVHALIGDQDEKFHATLDQAHRSAVRLDTTLVTLDRTVARLDTLLAQVQQGQGTLGKAVQDDELYRQMVATLEDAKALLADVRQNPKRYFKFSVF
ncbi:MAG TPA: hypothetical protein VFP10_11030, partial [Candidatus Eisenbacteria bacterium]|nr:hypothetical protein [Candidatus Eisenbacteria bacterium]